MRLTMRTQVIWWVGLMAAIAVAHPHHSMVHREKEDVIYDQRQNGTENYRLHIDGVVVALAPAEVLFNLASLVDFMPEFGGSSEEIPEDDLFPPKPEAGTEMELTTHEPEDASSTTEGASDKPQAADDEEIPNRDTSENAEKPATTTETAQTHKPTKKLKGKIFLSRWLLPLLRRL